MVYGSIFIQICAQCTGLQKTHIFCNSVRAYWPFKVVRGHPMSIILVQIESAYMRPPISPLLWLWSYLAPFLRYGDLLAKMPIFHTPLSFGDPAPYVPFGEVNHQETKLSSGEEWRPHDRSLLTWYRTVTDRQTDGQTESIIACRLHAALCIASYADAL